MGATSVTIYGNVGGNNDACGSQEDMIPVVNSARTEASSAILLYHSLDRSGKIFSTDPSMFRAHLEALVESGVETVPLEAILKSPGAIALTFDDGYDNFHEQALPLLIQHGLPATLFVVSGQCGGSGQWRSRVGPMVKQRLLSWSQLREISEAGVTIGAHSVSHDNLVSLPEDAVIREMRDCRIEIEDRIGRPVNVFAYPYGISDRRIRKLAQQEFRVACGTRLSLVDKNSDPFDLPRICDFYLRNYYLKRPARLRRLNQMEGRVYLAIRRWVSRTHDLFRSC